jgi:hypothetical protein
MGEVISYPRGKVPKKQMLFEIRDAWDNRVIAPMYLVMNPTTLNLETSWLINRYQTRGAWIEEIYGQNLDVISCTGSTGAFIGQGGLISTGGSYGISSTEAWRNFQALLSVYQNNGETFDPRGAVIKVGSVWLIFDQGVYVGYFSEFSFAEEAIKPFSFSLSFTFKVMRTVMGIAQRTYGE